MYFFVLNLVFIQFPLSGSLPGNHDTWANLAMFKDLGNNIQSYFGTATITSSNYPCQNTWPLFGLDFFSGLIFLAFKLLGLTDLWAYHFYITTIYALNSFGVYKICRCYSSYKVGCLLSGLFFSISNFMLGNIDNPNIVLAFAGFFAIYSLISALKESSGKRFVFSICFLSMQLLLAPITFVMIFFIWAAYLVFHYQALIHILTKNKGILFSFLILGVALMPYTYYYIILKIPTATNADKFNGQYMSVLSMNLNDFFRALPNSLFSHSIQTKWISNVKSGYTGIALICIALFGAWREKNSRYAIFIFLSGLILSMGPYFSINDEPIMRSPISILYWLFPFGNYFRIPSRFFLLALLGLVILFSIGLKNLKQKKPTSYKAFFFIILILYFGENYPFALQKYNSIKILSGSNSTQEFIRGSKFKNVLNLPSGLFVGNDEREYIYMYYQTINRKNTINGSLAYFPLIRLQNDSLCKQIGQADNLDKLIAMNSIDLIVFHSDLATNSDKEILSTLKISKNLLPIDTLGEKKLFAVIPTVFK